MDLMPAPMVRFALLVAAASLCTIAGATAALTANVRLAAAALSVTAAGVATIALIHFGEPLAAAALLITHGVAAVAMARCACQQDPTPLRGRAWLILIVAFTGVLLLALVPGAGSSTVASVPFSSNDAWLLALCAMAALAIIVGAQAHLRRNDDGADG